MLILFIIYCYICFLSYRMAYSTLNLMAVSLTQPAGTVRGRRHRSTVCCLFFIWAIFWKSFMPWDHCVRQPRYFDAPFPRYDDFSHLFFFSFHSINFPIFNYCDRKCNPTTQWKSTAISAFFFHFLETFFSFAANIILYAFAANGPPVHNKHLRYISLFGRTTWTVAINTLIQIN